MRVAIIGGVAGGATAAARLRRLREDAHITILERGPDVSFAGCGLPYYVGEEIRDRSKLLVHTPASLGGVLAVDVKTHHEVVGIDRAAKTIAVQGPDGARTTVPFDKLLISTGAAPLRPPIPGATGLPHVFTMRTVQDADAIKARVDALVARAAAGGTRGRAVVLGGGFIGLESVEALARRGLHVTMLEARDHVLPNVDADMVTALTNELRGEGVQVLTSQRAAAIMAAPGGADSLVVRLDSGAELPADVVIMAAGVRPETKLAQDAGLELDPASRAIAVNQHLQTSDPDIYAVGDAVAAPSMLDPTVKVWVPLGGPANRQARLAADHMVLGSEGATPYKGTLGTAIVRAFSAVVGSTGWGAEALTRMGRPFQTVTVNGYSHASFYSVPQPITLKATWDPATRRLLGASAFGGEEGVDKRLDVLATAIANGATVDSLADLELAYAPPFGSARDVINTLGFAAGNMRMGLLRAEPTLAAVAPERVLLDVRDPTSATVRPVPAPAGRAVVRLPYDELRAKLDSLDRSKSYATVCNVGKMSYFASRILQQSGFDATAVVGGVAMATPPIPNPPETIPAGRAGAAPLVAVSPAAGGGGGGPAAAVPAAPPRTVELDVCGLACPGPIMALRKAVSDPAHPFAPGSVLVAKASDPGFARDVVPFAESVGLQLASVTREKGVITATLKAPETGAPAGGCASAAAAAAAPASAAPAAGAPGSSGPYDFSAVVFSGDMDKVLAALVLANGAVAMGGHATLFMTFWGLNALRADGTFPDWESKRAAAPAEAGGPGEHRSALQAMMGAMLPKGPSSLPLSNMNMGGMGAAMMKKVMREHSLPTVESLMRSAMESGKVRFVACTMSMEAMGIPASALLPGVELGGVADFLSSASKSKTTLFI